MAERQAAKLLKNTPRSGEDLFRSTFITKHSFYKTSNDQRNQRKSSPRFFTKMPNVSHFFKQIFHINLEEFSKNPPKFSAFSVFFFRSNKIHLREGLALRSPDTGGTEKTSSPQKNEAGDLFLMAESVLGCFVFGFFSLK